jgi:NAD(P)-dependent dehydrogenase (short-subunit alcohol dehydrogenase family)
MKAWTVQNIPSQRGHQAVITGATGGLGYESALGLAAAGTQVVLTGRSATKGEAALQRIRSMQPAASISYETLDLASLASVQDFAERFKRSLDALDILVAEAR